MSSNDKSSFNFDLDDILSEFSSLDEEPVSEKPVFEPSEPLTDLSEKDDELFSALINDGIEAAPAQEVYDFDPKLIAEEFASEDSISESTASLDPESIRREFALDGSTGPSPLRQVMRTRRKSPAKSRRRLPSPSTRLSA